MKALYDCSLLRRNTRKGKLGHKRSVLYLNSSYCPALTLFLLSSLSLTALCLSVSLYLSLSASLSVCLSLLLSLILTHLLPHPVHSSSRAKETGEHYVNSYGKQNNNPFDGTRYIMIGRQHGNISNS